MADRWYTTITVKETDTGIFDTRIFFFDHEITKENVSEIVTLPTGLEVTSIHSSIENPQ